MAASSRRSSKLSAVALALALLARTAGARAEPPASASSAPSADERAAAAYDRGVNAFDHGEFAASARAFLDADAIAPSSDAISNAVVAARFGKDRALLEEAGTRAVARGPSNAHLAELGRQALEEARALPRAPKAPVEPAAADAGAAAATTDAVTPTPPEQERVSSSSEHATARSWSPTVFYVGVAVTAALVGATVWSGVDTLSARDRLPGTQSDNDAVMARAHRTDAFLAGAVVAGAATACAGVFLVNWEGNELRASVGPEQQSLVLRGHF